jgi:hypothetical protein
MTTITTPLPAHSNHRRPAVLAAFAVVAAVGVAAWTYNGQGNENQAPAQPADATSSAPVNSAPIQMTPAEEVQMIRDGNTKASAAPTELTLEPEFQATRTSSAPVNSAPIQMTPAEEVQMIQDGARK